MGIDTYYTQGIYSIQSTHEDGPRTMIHLDAHYNIITGQIAECMECHNFFPGIPLGFIYNDPASGWYQDDDTPFIEGYCKSCADTLAALDHADHINGNWEQRTIEDERWVWER